MRPKFHVRWAVTDENMSNILALCEVLNLSGNINCLFKVIFITIELKIKFYTSFHWEQLCISPEAQEQKILLNLEFRE